MNSPYAVTLIALAGLLLVGGCKKKNEPPTPVTVEEAAPTVETAFKDAAGDVKKDATEAVAALQRKDVPTAYMELQTLSARAELTDAQRQAATAAMLGIRAQLEKAATSGDRQAQQVLELHRANK